MTVRELAASLLVELVHLVQHEQARLLGGADLDEHVVHGVDHREQLVLRHGRVHHVQDQVRVERLLERGGERVHELMRKLADEADRVGDAGRCGR